MSTKIREVTGKKAHVTEQNMPIYSFFIKLFFKKVREMSILIAINWRKLHFMGEVLVSYSTFFQRKKSLWIHRLIWIK